MSPLKRASKRQLKIPRRQENEELNKQKNGKVEVKTYANVIVITECHKQLNTMPTKIDSNGNEVVVFDEVLVGEGSKRCRVGKPMVMDDVTTIMCKNGVGKVRYAKVLVEVSAQKPLPDDIEIIYKNGLDEVIYRKNVKVMYDWKPLIPNTQPPRTGNNKQVKSKEKQVTQFAYQPKKKDVNEGHGKSEGMEAQKKGVDKINVEKHNSQKQASPKKAWSVHGEILFAMRRYANKYNVLEMYNINKQGELNDMRNRELEELVNKGKANFVQSKKIIEEDDVCQDDSGSWNIRRLSTSDKRKEVKKYTGEKALSICTFIETNLKAKNLQRIGDSIFEDRDWIYNMKFCDKLCIIMLGWNSDVVNLNVIHCAKQSLLCKVDTTKGNTKLFCTFVYATNRGNEMRELRKDLELYKRIFRKEAWVMLGGMNVTLAPNGHSSGSSFMNGDINEFRDCINNIGMEDVKRAFKFSNFVADEEEFLPLNGDVFENVKLREKQKEYVAAMKDEEKLLYQKAEVKWISIGDRNNAYFHKVLKSRNHKCRINRNDDCGNKYEGDDVARQFVRHFQKFLGEEVQVKHMKNVNMLIKNKLFEAEANNMVRDVSNAEIKEAMFLINGNKAPGPDGFSSLHIQDNILSSQELLKGYERKEGPKRVAMKTDIQKSYNTVNWKFLESILYGFGFLKRMVDWIIKCGDPMSPYLFTLVMKILSLIVQEKVENRKEFKYHSGCRSMKLTHVCFADDLLMFCHVDMNYINVLKEAIEYFRAY
ncbi:RNA-directed DNA polymerase, eukaryota, reverse transcriptase zinc-binding domain protein [Tanacetum coccineum]